MNSYTSPNPWFFMNSRRTPGYHGFLPFLMGEIFFKILSKEYCEKYRETYSDFMETLKRILS